MFDLSFFFFMFATTVCCLPQSGLLDDNNISTVETTNQATNQLVSTSDQGGIGASPSNPDSLPQISFDSTNKISSDNVQEQCKSTVSSMSNPAEIERRDSPVCNGLKLPGFGSQQPKAYWDPRQRKTSPTATKDTRICPKKYGRRVLPICPSPLDFQISLLADDTVTLHLAAGVSNDFQTIEGTFL